MRYPLVYGGIAGVIIIGIVILTVTLDLPRHFESEWFGYLVMLTALSMIFVGVKRYRDTERGGVISFGRAFGVGLGIALVASAIYVVGWELYLAISGKDFMAEYARTVIDHMRADGADQAAIGAKLSEMRSLAASYRSPLFRIPMTFVEIFPVGLIVTLVSATLLRNPRVLPSDSMHH